MVHEQRDENRQAADCYRRVIAFLEQHPDYSDPGFKDEFAARIASSIRSQADPARDPRGSRSRRRLQP